MNYVDFFGFSHEPFALGPSVRGFYNSARHSAVLRELSRPADDGCTLYLLRGSQGTGRTTVALQFLDQLSPEIWGRAYVDANIVEGNLARVIRVQCGVAPGGNLADLVGDDGYEQLAIVLDHADRADLASLQAEVPAGVIVAIVDSAFDATGMPDAVVLDLAPLNARGAGKYIQDRLVRAGGRRDLFSKAVLSRIFELSQGVPARINELCTSLLIGAAHAGADTVDDDFLALLPTVEPSHEVETAMEHLDEATMDLAGAAELDDAATAGAIDSAESDEATGAGTGLVGEAGLEVEEEVAAEDDLDAVLDDLGAGVDETPQGDEPAHDDGAEDVDLDALMADLGAEADHGGAAEEAEPEPAEEATSIDLEVERQLSDAAEADVDEDLALEELMGAVESVESESIEPVGSDDDLLGELDASIRMPDESTDSAAEDVDLDAMLGELEAGVEGEPAGDEAGDVDLDAMLDEFDAATDDLADSTDGAHEDDVDLDALMAELEGDETQAADDGDAGELDDLIGELEGDLSTSSSATEDDVDIDALLGDLEADDGSDDDDIDQLLGELDEQATASGSGDDDIDALLNELDGRDDRTQSEEDDELDDLLSQIDQLQDG